MTSTFLQYCSNSEFPNPLFKFDHAFYSKKKKSGHVIDESFERTCKVVGVRRTRDARVAPVMVVVVEPLAPAARGSHSGGPVAPLSPEF